MQILDVLAMTWTVPNTIFLRCTYIILKLLAAAPPKQFVTDNYKRPACTYHVLLQSQHVVAKNINFSIFSTTVIAKRISKNKACQLAKMRIQLMQNIQ